MVKEILSDYLCCIANRRDPLGRINVILLLRGLIRLSNTELLNVIQYGHGQLSPEPNAKILKATLAYIHTFKRFE